MPRRFLPHYFDGIEECGLASNISTFRTSNNKMSPNPSSHHPTFAFLSFFLETQTSHPSLTQIPIKKCRKHPPKQLPCLPWGAFCWSHFEHLWSGGDLGKGSLNGTHFGGESNKTAKFMAKFQGFPLFSSAWNLGWGHIMTPVWGSSRFQLLEMFLVGTFGFVS